MDSLEAGCAGMQFSLPPDVGHKLENQKGVIQKGDRGENEVNPLMGVTPHKGPFTERRPAARQARTSRAPSRHGCL